MPDLGIGVGYRVPHYAQVVEHRPAMDWFEVLAENFMVNGGSPRFYLERLREHYRVVPHGVSLSLGSDADPEHLQRLSALIQELRPPWFSDHLCMTGVSRRQIHDLLPLPYTPAVRDHVVARIREIQDRTGTLFALENVSSYLGYTDSVMPEWAFYAEVVEAADCAMLLDVNNVYVSSINHGFDPKVYLDAVPADRVVQVHLAGHMERGAWRLDTHDRPVIDPVWALYRHLIRRTGPVSTLIEWDDNIPSFSRLQAEAELARQHRDRALSGAEEATDVAG